MYSGLGSEDVAAITTQLKAVGVPFAVTDGGQTILAPKDQIDSGRLAVAGHRPPQAETFWSPWRVTNAPKSQKCRLTGPYAQVPEVLGMSESDARSYNQALGRTARLVAKFNGGAVNQSDAAQAAGRTRKELPSRPCQ